MKKLFLTLFIFHFSLFIAYGQDWVRMMQDPNVNVHDVQDAFYKWYGTQKSNQAKGIIDMRNGKEEMAEQGYELFKRWEYKMVARTFPSGVRPDKVAITNQYNKYKAMHKPKHGVASASNWTYVGNNGVPTYGGDGRINRVHFYPGNDSIIFACSPSGGLWKSVDAGNTWSTNTDQLLEIGTGDMAINPLKPSIMYLGTGDNDAGGDGTPTTIGVLRSHDGGLTWDTTGFSYALPYSGTNTILVNQLIFNPTDTSTLFAATSVGVYYTKDNGATWTQSINDNIKDIEFEPFHGATVYAGSYTGKFYRSTDSGKTFTRILGGLPSNGVGRLAIGVTPADSNTVYVLAVESSYSRYYGLYRSTDRGQTFTTQSSWYSGTPNLLGWSNTGSDTTGQAWYNLVIQVSPTHADSVFVAGSWLWTSSDGGVTWTFNNSVYSSVHIDIHSITFFPGSSSAFLLSSDGGIFKTPDAGNTWTNISNNLAIGEQYSIGLSADNPDFYITGWQDNGSSISSPGWKAVYGGDGMTDFIDYTNDLALFASYENGNFASSYDGGNTWGAANLGITEGGDWNTPWMQDPQNPNVLFAGFKNVWESSDQGNNWGVISTWGGYLINALAVAPSNDSYMYASEYYELQGTTDGGATWNNITGSLPVSFAYISAIAIDPVNPTHVWVTFSGWNSNYKVYKTTNGGATWTNISAGLPNLPVNCIVYQAGTNDGIYIGTDIGVYYMDNTTGGWIPFNTGLPNVEIYDLKIYAPDNKLLAATYGRGTWETSTFANAGIKEASFTNSFKVYPNPAANTIKIEAYNAGGGDVAMNIADITGRVVMQKNLESKTNAINSTVDVSSLQTGIYLVSLKEGNEVYTTKLVKQ